jgi:competence protein ComEA
MWHWLERHRGPILLFLIALILIGGAVFLYRQVTPGGALEVSLAPSQEITVYVDGEVINPGTYNLPQGARVDAAIEVAGGFTSDAYTQELNLAQRLWDGDRVHIPKIGEVPQKVNINTADAWLLEALPGIGEVLAQRIIDYRTENRPFLSIEEIKNVEGVGEETYNGLKDLITVY